MQQCVSCKSTTPLVISVSRLSFWIALLDSFGQSHSKTSRLLFSRTISSINSVNHNIFGRWSICALAGHLLREFELRCKKLTARRTPPPHRWNYCIIRVVTANVRIISKLGVVTCHRNARYAAECNKSEVDFNVALGHEFNISFFARALGIPKQRFEKRNHICGPEQASDTYKKKKKNVSHALTFLIFVVFFCFLSRTRDVRDWGRISHAIHVAALMYFKIYLFFFDAFNVWPTGKPCLALKTKIKLKLAIETNVCPRNRVLRL